MLTRQERVTLIVEGLGMVLDLGVFDTFDGGAKKGETVKHRAGNMGDSEAVGGVSSREDFTVSRRYRLERDHPNRKKLDALVNIGRVTCVRQKLNPDKTAFGDPDTYTGIMSGFVMPNHDSDAVEKAMFSIEVNADEAIS
jgi:hypothetical protein